MKNNLAMEIQKRAYELFLDRGCQEGFDLEDWLQAEKEVSGSSTPAVKTKKATIAKKK